METAGTQLLAVADEGSIDGNCWPHTGNDLVTLSLSMALFNIHNIIKFNFIG